MNISFFSMRIILDQSHHGSSVDPRVHPGGAHEEADVKHCQTFYYFNHFETQFHNFNHLKTKNFNRQINNVNA